MLARTVCRGCCSGGPPRLVYRAARATPRRVPFQQCRRYSSAGLGASPGGGAGSSLPSPSAGPSPAAFLAPFTSELDRISPAFHIHGSQVQILQTPSEFYDTLKDKIRRAESRIFLSTLYIGAGEAELVRDAPGPAAAGAAGAAAVRSRARGQDQWWLTMPAFCNRSPRSNAPSARDPGSASPS